MIKPLSRLLVSGLLLFGRVGIRLISQILRWIFGQKMESSRIHEEKLSIFWGMPILSSDAISSVAYAVEEILLVLIPVIGIASFIWMPRIALVIIMLLLVLTFSYRQVV